MTSNQDQNVENKYTTDGLEYKKYINSDIKRENKKVFNCEACNKYFLISEYYHTSKYKFSVDGIHTCIHCYYICNINKYINDDNTVLTELEKKCVNYYITNYTSNHDIENCIGVRINNKCLLCYSKKNILPLSVISDKIIYKKKPMIGYDIRAYVKQSYPHKFILTL